MVGTLCACDPVACGVAQGRLRHLLRTGLTPPCTLCARLWPQPKQINEIKDFLLTARRRDAKCTLACSCLNHRQGAKRLPLAA
jgi:hypothetical protein